MAVFTGTEHAAAVNVRVNPPKLSAKHGRIDRLFVPVGTKVAVCLVDGGDGNTVAGSIAQAVLGEERDRSSRASDRRAGINDIFQVDTGEPLEQFQTGGGGLGDDLVEIHGVFDVEAVGMSNSALVPHGDIDLLAGEISVADHDTHGEEGTN